MKRKTKILICSVYDALRDMLPNKKKLEDYILKGIDSVAPLVCVGIYT